jgi:putative peptidoglycan lipid II flippase
MSRKLLRATAVVGGFTLISRVLGFVRDIVIAHGFGASALTDAFLVAFKIPNFLRRLFAEGAFSQAFVPVLSEYKTQRSPEEARDLDNHVAGTLGGILLLVTLLGVIAAPLLVLLFAPGFTAEADKYRLTVEMLRITFPYLLFISLTAFAGAILNAYGRFAVPALTPVLLNLVLIAAVLWWSPHFAEPVMALAWGVFLAGVLQLLFQLPFLWRAGLLPRPRFDRRHEGVRRVLKLMLPALFGVSVTQINLLVDTLMASFLAAGSVSWLYYADRLIEFPIGVFGMALATVMLPSLSRSVAQGQLETYGKTLDWSLRWVFLIGLPCTFGLAALAQPIMSTLFLRGEFAAHDVNMSARALLAYTVGLLGFVLIKVLASGFYARQNTRTPVRIGVIAMFVNIGLNLILIWPLAHAGLALSTACAATVNAFLLFHGLRREGVYRSEPGWTVFLLRTGLASASMGALLWWGTHDLAAWLELSTWGRAGHLLAWVGAGGAAYFAALGLLGLRPRHLRQAGT